MKATAEYTTSRLTGISLMAAVIVVLQFFATTVNFITPGTIPIALILPPIVVGAAMYGIKPGMFLGFCFGAIVLITGIFGLAPLSAYMFGASPLATTVGTLGRGIAVGAAAGLVYKIFEKKNLYLGVIVAALVVPFVNTGIFAVVYFIFLEVITQEGNGRTVLYYASGFIIGINFLIELIYCAVLAPTIARIVTIVQKRSTKNGSGH
ncbi:MAG: ECF transporter S component [Defluviitaleaceae bacterium]|nr:ECF transporter S component [Defluviitaleaceae bacterium]